MHTKGLSVYIPDQTEIFIGTCRNHPGHWLNTELRIHRICFINNVLYGINRHFPRLFGKIPGISTIPDRSMRCTNNIHTAFCTNLIRHFQLIDRVSNCLFPFPVIHSKNIFPNADLGND